MSNWPFDFRNCKKSQILWVQKTKIATNGKFIADRTRISLETSTRFSINISLIRIKGTDSFHSFSIFIILSAEHSDEAAPLITPNQPDITVLPSENVKFMCQSTEPIQWRFRVRVWTFTFFLKWKSIFNRWIIGHICIPNVEIILWRSWSLQFIQSDE